MNDELSGFDPFDGYFLSFQQVHDPIVVELLVVSDQIRTESHGREWNLQEINQREFQL
jgi:hypothetical protein